MNRNEHLLTIIGEECSEIHKATSKALRFGMQDIAPGKTETNETKILQEFNDLVAVMEMFFETPIQNIISRSEVANKKLKVQEFFNYSTAKGTLSDFSSQKV